MYFTVMRHQWPTGGPIPMDEVEVLIGKPWLSTRDAFRRRFAETGGTISLVWVEEEREKRVRFSEMQSTKGKLGGRPSKRKNLRVSRSLTETKPNESPRVGKGISRVEVLKEVEELPFASANFTSAWDGFVAMRIEKKKPMTDRARKLIVADLLKMGEANSILSLNASTRAGWTDVYPPKPNANGQPTGETRSQELDRIIAERYGTK